MKKYFLFAAMALALMSSCSEKGNPNMKAAEDLSKVLIKKIDNIKDVQALDSLKIKVDSIQIIVLSEEGPYGSKNSINNDFIKDNSEDEEAIILDSLKYYYDKLGVKAKIDSAFNAKKQELTSKQ